MDIDAPYRGPHSLLQYYAKNYLALTPVAQGFVGQLAEVWCRYYEYDPDRGEIQMKYELDPHGRMTNVPEKDRACHCQIGSHDHVDWFVELPMCICFGFRKARWVHKLLLTFSPEPGCNTSKWKFKTQAQRQWLADAWYMGGYGRQWGGSEDPPEYYPEHGNVIQDRWDSMQIPNGV